MVQHVRKAVRKSKIARSEMKLRKAVASRSRQPFPKLMKVDGAWTADREEWSKGLCKFGEERYEDQSNTETAQQQRIDMLTAVVKNEQLDGKQMLPISPFDVLQGIAGMKGNTAAGYDGAPPEIYQNLPFLAFFRFWKLFNNFWAILLELLETYGQPLA